MQTSRERIDTSCTFLNRGPIVGLTLVLGLFGSVTEAAAADRDPTSRRTASLEAPSHLPERDEVRPASSESTNATEAPAPPYSIPWSLRPAAVPNVVRLDTGFALRESDGTANPTTPSTVMATTLGFGLRITGDFGLLAKAALVQRFDSSANATAFSNPSIGALYAPKLAKGLRAGIFTGIVLPVGTSGTAETGADLRQLMRVAGAARGAMDNSLFAVSYATLPLGLGLSYVDHGLTAQVEATGFLQLRTRGATWDAEPSRGALTAAAHVGYAIFPWLLPSVELRHQRWLSTPAPVVANPASRDTSTVAFGLRTAIPMGPHLLLRPGVAYSEPLDQPLVKSGTHMVQLDVPVVFR
jgi:hypothetical protein